MPRDLQEQILNRIELIGEVLSVADGPPARGWSEGAGASKYDRQKESSLQIYGGGRGEDIWYARPQRWGGKSSSIQVWNVHPVSELRDEEIEMYETGAPEIIHGLTVPLENFMGLTELNIDYTPDFRKTVRLNDVRMQGFTESLSITIGLSQGSDAAQFKANQEITAGFEARQESTSESEKSSEQGHATTFYPSAPPGVDKEYWAIMTAQQKVVKTTGFGDVDFGFACGMRERGKWSKHRGKYVRHVTFQSFWNEFLPVIKGEVRSGLDCAGHFFNNPAPKHLIEALEAPLEMPFNHESLPFDGWINIEPHQKVIRVNQAINPELYEIWQKSLV